MRHAGVRSIQCVTWIYITLHPQERPVKKGRHRRFEEARALKRTTEPTYDDLVERAGERSCEECGADPGHDHASWCMAETEVEEPWT